MEIITTKPATRANFGSKVGYLGTTADHTKAHNNPKKRLYNRYRKLFNQTHDPKYQNLMERYKVYTKRDLVTFGNLDVSHGTRGLVHQIKQIMKHNNRKIIGREFVIMPANSDHINPNDPDSVYHFQRYVQMFMAKNFHHRFKWYAVIQPDSKQNGRIHCHCFVISNDLTNGRAMAGKYYHVTGHGPNLRRSLLRTTKDYNKRFRDYHMSMPTGIGLHAPNITERVVVQGLTAAKDNPNIIGRAKLAKFLYHYKDRKIIAKHHYNRKHKARSGWSFQYGNHRRVKGYRISRTKHGAIAKNTSIDKMLAHNRQLRAKIKSQRKSKQASASAVAKSKANHPARRSVSSSAVTYQPVRNSSSKADFRRSTMSYNSYHAMSNLHSMMFSSSNSVSVQSTSIPSTSTPASSASAPSSSSSNIISGTNMDLADEFGVKTVTLVTLDSLPIRDPYQQQNFGAELDLSNDYYNSHHYRMSHDQYEQRLQALQQQKRLRASSRRAIQGYFRSLHQHVKNIKSHLAYTFHRACHVAKGWMSDFKIKFEPWRSILTPKVDPVVHHIKPTKRYDVGSASNSSGVDPVKARIDRKLSEINKNNAPITPNPYPGSSKSSVINSGSASSSSKDSGSGSAPASSSTSSASFIPSVSSSSGYGGDGSDFEP